MNKVILILLFVISSCSGLNTDFGRSSHRKIASTSKSNSCLGLAARILLKERPLLKKDNLYDALKKKYSAAKARTVEKNINSLYFISYSSSFDIYRKMYEGKASLHGENIFDLYADSGKNTFKNFLDGERYLLDEKPEFSLGTLKKLHRKMMKGNIDDIAEADLGKIRIDATVGSVYAQEPISEQVYKNLEENPYIATDWLKLNKKKTGYYGDIAYPSPMLYTKFVENKIKKLNKGLHKKLLLYKKTEEGDFGELTRDMINVLTEDLLKWFVRQRDQIGDISSQAKLVKYAKVVAKFQRDLISIHPFSDGNGRTIRSFALYYPMIEKGFIPPRLAYPDADIYSSLDEWAEQILAGMLSGQRTFEAIEMRLAKGLPLENTPELLLFKNPEKIAINKRWLKPKKNIADYKEEVIDSSQFAEFFYQVVVKNKKRLKEYKKNPYEENLRVLKEYESFFKNSRMDVVHPKFGEENIGVSFVDRDFIYMFADKSYNDIDKWNYKMSRWYKKDIQWRGLADQEAVATEKELLSMFTNLHTHFVSNNVLDGMGNSVSPAKIKKLAQKDFESYNQDLVTDGLSDMAKHHSEALERYYESYGYSTSQKRIVAKAFAMGAMVVAEYGEQQKFQHLLKSRVVVGLRTANKDINLSRLKQLRPSFSYKYPRQKEIMGIGAADPDAVMFVQTIDENGDVILTYMRNNKNPKEILVFEGEVSTEKGIDLSQAVRNIILK